MYVNLPIALYDRFYQTYQKAPKLLRTLIVEAIQRDIEDRLAVLNKPKADSEPTVALPMKNTDDFIAALQAELARPRASIREPSAEPSNYDDDIETGLPTRIAGDTASDIDIYEDEGDKEDEAEENEDEDEDGDDEIRGS